MLLVGIGMAVAACAGSSATAQLIYADDFENGVSGWSVNASASSPATTQFLGRFAAGNTTTSRTFTVPPGSASVVIDFDFYRLDSWDNNAQYGYDRFRVDINGAQIFSVAPIPMPSPLTGSNGNASWSFTAIGNYVDRAFNPTREDQFMHVRIILTDPPTNLTLTLHSLVDQVVDDESGGYDNFRIEAVPHPPHLTVTKTAVPAPGGMGAYLPGEDIIYAIDLVSTGGPLNPGSLHLADLLPPEVTMFTGPFGASPSAVEFTDLSATASGVTCCDVANVAYSTTTNPTVYGYTPDGAYDPHVGGIMVTPSGTVREGVTSPVRLRFRIRARNR
jgi:hypothetical protein